jgi:hypothetical protein
VRSSSSCRAGSTITAGRIERVDPHARHREAGRALREEAALLVDLQDAEGIPRDRQQAIVRRERREVDHEQRALRPFEDGGDPPVAFAARVARELLLRLHERGEVAVVLERVGPLGELGRRRRAERLEQQLGETAAPSPPRPSTTSRSPPPAPSAAKWSSSFPIAAPKKYPRRRITPGPNAVPLIEKLPRAEWTSMLIIPSGAAAEGVGDLEVGQRLLQLGAEPLLRPELVGAQLDVAREPLVQLVAVLVARRGGRQRGAAALPLGEEEERLLLDLVGERLAARAARERAHRGRERRPFEMEAGVHAGVEVGPLDEVELVAPGRLEAARRPGVEPLVDDDREVPGVVAAVARAAIGHDQRRHAADGVARVGDAVEDRRAAPHEERLGAEHALAEPLPVVVRRLGMADQRLRHLRMAEERRELVEPVARPDLLLVRLHELARRLPLEQRDRVDPLGRALRRCGRDPRRREERGEAEGSGAMAHARSPLPVPHQGSQLYGSKGETV